MTVTTFDEDTQGFNTWLKENFDKISPKVKIEDLRKDNQGRGLIATESIEKDEVLFELSRNSIINVETSALNHLQPQNNDVLMSLNQWEALILCLAYEFMLSDKSKWFAYFRVLPTDNFNSLMFWNDDELKFLRPSNVLNRIGKAQAEEMYHRLVPNVVDRLGAVELSNFLTLEKFHVIATLIMSYSFDVDHPEQVEEDENEDEQEETQEQEPEEKQEDCCTNEDCEDGTCKNPRELEESMSESDFEDEDEAKEDQVKLDPYFKSMVPLADTLNANTTLFNATLKYEHSKLTMTATKPISKGDQIYNIYGELPNSEILRKYGYVELPSSQHEFSELSLDIIGKFYQSQSIDDHFNKANASNPEILFTGIIKLIAESEYLDETLEDNEGGIILDNYEIFKDGELLPELSLLLLILSTLYSSFCTDYKWFKKLFRGINKPNSEFESFVNRTILKCYQLLESSRFTNGAVGDLKKIVGLRLAQYPDQLASGDFTIPENYAEFSRKHLAQIVLKNEVDILQNVQNGGFPPKNEQNGKLKLELIEDEKLLKNLLKNVLKRKAENDQKKNDRSTDKRSKRKL